MIVMPWIRRAMSLMGLNKPSFDLQPGDLVIDVSHHNGSIDWLRVARQTPKVKGAILKATEGATVMDRQFFRNVAGCEANGIPWGAYHFATWNSEDEDTDARHEAQFFVSIIKGAKGTPRLPLILDIETNKHIPYTKMEMEVYVGAFLDVLKKYNRNTGIYASPGFLNEYLSPDHPFTDELLMVADYTGQINPVPGWKKPWIRQYTDKGTVEGISGKVDLNVVL